MTILGGMYSSINHTLTENIKIDDKKAIYWLNNSIKAYNQNIVSNLNENIQIGFTYQLIGLIYNSEYSREFDIQKAIENYKIIAEVSNNKYGASILGFNYYTGRGTERNISLAKKWFEMSANAENSFSQYMLGKIYIDYENNQDQGVFWLQNACDNNEEEACQFLNNL